MFLINLEKNVVDRLSH